MGTAGEGREERGGRGERDRCVKMRGVNYSGRRRRLA